MKFVIMYILVGLIWVIWAYDWELRGYKFSEIADWIISNSSEEYDDDYVKWFRKCIKVIFIAEAILYVFIWPIFVPYELYVFIKHKGKQPNYKNIKR